MKVSKIPPILIMVSLCNILVLCSLKASNDSVISERNDMVPEHTKTSIIVGLPIVPGIISLNQNGEPEGYPVEVLQQALVDENIPHHWVEGSWPKLYEKILNNEIDILPYFQVSKGVVQNLDFLELTLSTMWSELYLGEHFEFNSITDLSLKHIGLIEHDNNTVGFVNFIRDFKILYTPVYFDSYGDALEKLSYGEIDALVGPQSSYMSIIDSSVKSSGLFFNPTNVTIAFAKNFNPHVQKQLNDRIYMYMQDPNSVFNSINTKKTIQKSDPKRFAIPSYLKVIIIAIILLIFISLAFISLLREQVKSKTNELLVAKDKAEENERLKSAFLANMSHEIRTPLNSILGFSDMLTQEDLEEDQKKGFVKIIHRQNNLLLRLINDIIEISKIESGSVKIRKNQIKRIDQLIGDIYDNFQEICPETIELRRSIELPENVIDLSIDVIRVKQILNNLMSNAFKYSSKGIVTIGCRLDDQGRLAIFVKDQGIGIAASDVEFVFDRFNQINSLSQGAGLGLPICKLLAELMDGVMSVVSEPGKGSEFILTLNSYK